MSNSSYRVRRGADGRVISARRVCRLTPAPCCASCKQARVPCVHCTAASLLPIAPESAQDTGRMTEAPALKCFPLRVGCRLARGLLTDPSSLVLTFPAGLHAECPRQGDRSSENHCESPREEATAGHVGLCAPLQSQDQRPGQGREQLAHLGQFR